ncbi:hypothetical protein [Gordonia soli]
MRRNPMDPTIEYAFGVGDGHTTTWTSVADADLDGDGRLDAVWLDFDGDGRRDDAMWDSDGDGIADTAVLDADGDAGRHFHDSGRGLWDQPVERSADDPSGARPGRQDTPESGGREVRPADPPVDAPPAEPSEPGPAPRPGRVPDEPAAPSPAAPSTPRVAEPDVGESDDPGTTRVLDLNRDGRVDAELHGTRRAGIPVATHLYVDENGDGTFDRVLVDTDGDGRADATHDRRWSGFRRR